VRILIVNQFFWPDVAPTGQYLCDLVRHLSAEGHEVTVICSEGAYSHVSDHEEEPPPATILRIPGFTYRRGAIARLLSYTTFFAGALWYQLRTPRPDVTVSMTTPPLLAVAGNLMKALRGTKHFIWEMDIFPDAFVSLGALTAHGLAARVLGKIQAAVRRRSDGIIVLGPCMRTRLLGDGTPDRLIHVAENWADGTRIQAGPNRGSGPLNIFYSGNLGLAHDVDTIAEAIRHFNNDGRFRFTFAGGGVGRDRLEKLCSAGGFANVSFPPYVTREQMNEHLSQADLGLVTERSACIGTVVPSKTYALMAAGRPILFIGPKESTPALLLERFQCGWQVDPGDTEMLVSLLEWLADRRETLWVHGQRARAAFETHYDLPLGVARVAAALGLGPEVKAPLWDLATIRVADNGSLIPKAT
jgi:colanic acid biosynthesis glycosyl transferase WcaI